MRGSMEVNTETTVAGKNGENEERDEQSTRMQHWFDFAGDVSMHGIQYIGDRNLRKFRR